MLIGFYSIRKLLDAPTKISDSTKELLFLVTWHRNLRLVNWRNNHRIDTLYDLKVAHRENRSIRFIANGVIHSFILALSADSGGKLEGIYFTSDYDKDEKLYALQIDEVVQIFECVGRDYPSTIHWSHDPDTGDESLEVR